MGASHRDASHGVPFIGVYPRKRVPHRRASHERAPHCVYLTGMYVMGMHLIGMRLIGVYIMDGGEKGNRVLICAIQIV